MEGRYSLTKVLILNGSPRIQQSNTLQITKAFLDGMNSQESFDVQQLDIYDKNIEIQPCIGCFNCWTKTPGTCIYQDSMPTILADILRSDILIWSFPLYYFGLPSKLKACMDRLLPFNQPFMTEGKAGHVARYDLSRQKTVVISSGGLSTVRNNFEALRAQFDLMLAGHGTKYSEIFCAQSPLLSVPQLGASNGKYLQQVFEAGREYVESGALSQQTKETLETPMYPIEIYNQMADASWEIASRNEDKDVPSRHKLLPFTKQMALLYHPKNYKNDIVLEIEYTDYEERYQLLLKKDKAEVIADNLQPYTTKIKTPYTVWEAISKGELSGANALMSGQYKVLGDLDVMMHWDQYFGDMSAGASDSDTQQKASAKKANTNMDIMLIPWILMWILLPINQVWGGLLTLSVTLALPLFFSKTPYTLYDKLSALIVAMISAFALVPLSYRVLQPISYFLFAALWLGSLLTPVPLSAHYSNAGFGGEEAFKNIIFMKTNLILSACWGVLYVCLGIVSLVAKQQIGLEKYVLVLNIILPIFLGIFTLWFQTWYPKRKIAGK